MVGTIVRNVGGREWESVIGCDITTQEAAGLVELRRPRTSLSAVSRAQHPNRCTRGGG